jgi:hypothetical protein
MAGGWQTYRCDRCPLVIELGGYTRADLSGVVDSQTAQVACAACGTMHRITEECGVCRVAALPGPVRSARTVRRRDITGQEIETEEWVAENDWQPVGRHARGIGAVAQLPCNCCGRVGQMLSLERFLYPGGYQAGSPRREACPVCLGPMACIAITEAI